MKKMSLKNKTWRITLKQKVSHNCKKIEYSATNFVVRAIILCEAEFHLTFFSEMCNGEFRKYFTR